jgi:hypothetical protein
VVLFASGRRDSVIATLIADVSTGDPFLREVPFQAHIELLQVCLSRRDEIVDRIQLLLNAQKRPIEYLQDGALLSRHFEDCVFTLPGLTRSQVHLRGQLEHAHWASGFKPRPIPGLHNGAADPAELMMRVFHLWRQTRWPGRNGRLRYAHTLFNLFVVRCLELLSMRIWDAGPGSAAERLSQVQGVLDRLRTISAADQPLFVKDARWLIPLAQSLATDELAAYFHVAERIADSLPPDDRTEIHAAGVRMAGGHLRSQIRYHSVKKALSPDEENLISHTRTSNALDFALLVQELVPLLEAYHDACQRGDGRTRRACADAICQGISPDPELFVNRVDLLGAYSMLEHLFIATDASGHMARTPIGRRHLQSISDYQSLIECVADPLREDCLEFRPVSGAYSPYGVLYGFSTDLVKHMALKASQPGAISHFSLEDVFAAGDASTGKLAWVNGWRQLPHLTPDVQRLFDYPQTFAEQMFGRIERALRRRASGEAVMTDPPTGRLYVCSGDSPPLDSTLAAVPDLPVRYIASSDAQIVTAHRAVWVDESNLLSDRREGKYLVSFQTAGGWMAIRKAVLTEILGAGRDVRIVGLPATAAAAVKLMCPTLIVLPPHARP